MINIQLLKSVYKITGFTMAVSYTHLDVYKRQTLTWRFGLVRVTANNAS